MKPLFKIFLTLSLILMSLSSHADSTVSLEDLFAQGNELYFDKKYEEAKTVFSEILTRSPENVDVITNLALAEFNLKNNFVALGLFRKALVLDPTHSEALQGIKYVSQHTSLREVPRQIPLSESLRSSFLNRVPTPVFLLMSLLLFFYSAWTGISYFATRRKAIAAEAQLPSLSVNHFIAVLLFVLFTGGAIFKLFDQSILRGTITTEEAQLQTSPGENQVTILDVYGGMEVVIHQIHEGWAQITYPGSVTGWIKADKLVMTR